MIDSSYTDEIIQFCGKIDVSVHYQVFQTIV